jgi:NAD(P)H-hydrate epimerase
MQIFTTAQVHAWDEFTINHEPVASIDLMERAASACYRWLLGNGYQDRRFSIFCGKGNNGGDGLAIARLLSNSGHEVYVYILEFGHLGTDDFQQNLSLLHETNAAISFVSNEETIPELVGDHVVVDAIFGSGLNRPLEGLTSRLVDEINGSANEVIAIDLPTGMFGDRSTPKQSSIIKARHTLTFQSYKLSFFFAESAAYLGQLHILDIGLHPGFAKQVRSDYELLDYEFIRQLIKPRRKFSHKGDYGHGALVTGSKGLMGASTLAARACMRSGAGKLTCHIPEAGYTIMQVAAPEAMSLVEKGKDHITAVGSLEKYDAVGIGPGIGLYDSHSQLLSSVFRHYKKPCVIDADALNILSRNKDLLREIPAGSILTPHTREFERLFGEHSDDGARLLKATKEAARLNCIIVLKGPHTLIATPSGKCYFNNSGNPGMATGGTGDVLTGVITGLLCQGYTPDHAAIVGVFIHGLAGDIAAVRLSMQSLIASDVIEYLGEAFKRFEGR